MDEHPTIIQAVNESVESLQRLFKRASSPCRVGPKGPGSKRGLGPRRGCPVLLKVPSLSYIIYTYDGYVKVLLGVLYGFME